MSENVGPAFRREVRSIFLKCALSVLLATLMIVLVVGYFSEVDDGICASISWIIEAITLAKNTFYAGFTYWSWVPAVAAAGLVVTFLWLACVCSSMRKKCLYSPLYAGLEKAKVRMGFISFLGICFYAPVSPEHVGFFIIAFMYGVILVSAWITENHCLIED